MNNIYSIPSLLMDTWWWTEGSWSKRWLYNNKCILIITHLWNEIVMTVQVAYYNLVGTHTSLQFKPPIWFGVFRIKVKYARLRNYIQYTDHRSYISITQTKIFLFRKSNKNDFSDFRYNYCFMLSRLRIIKQLLPTFVSIWETVCKYI